MKSLLLAFALLAIGCQPKSPAPPPDPGLQLTAGKAMLEQSLKQLTDLSAALRKTGAKDQADELDLVINSTSTAATYFDAGLSKVDDLNAYYIKQQQDDQATIVQLQSDQKLRAWMDLLAGAGGFAAAIGIGLLVFLGAAMRGLSLSVIAAGLAGLAIGVFVRESLPYASYVVIPGVIVLGVVALAALGYGLFIAIRAVRENVQQMHAAKLPIAGVSSDSSLNAAVSNTTRRLNSAIHRKLKLCVPMPPIERIES